MSKQCKKCLEEKPLNLFVKEKRNKDGRTKVCKACRNDSLRTGPKKMKRYIGEDKQECSSCHKIKPLSCFGKRKHSLNGYSERCKECHVGSPKPHKAYWRLIEKQKLYDIPIEITKEDVAMIFEAFEGTCIYCGVEESEETGTMNLEHIIPMASGGRHHASNLVISCKSCNAKKQDKPLITFYRSHQPFDGIRLDYIFKHVAYFSNRDPEEVAREFYDAAQKEVG